MTKETKKYLLPLLCGFVLSLIDIFIFSSEDNLLQKTIGFFAVFVVFLATAGILYWISKKVLNFERKRFSTALWYSLILVLFSFVRVGIEYLSIIRDTALISGTITVIRILLGIFALKSLYSIKVIDAVRAYIMVFVSKVIITAILGSLVSITALTTKVFVPTSQQKTNTENTLRIDHSKLPKGFPVPEEREVIYANSARQNGPAVTAYVVVFKPTESLADWKSKYEDYINRRGLVKEEENTTDPSVEVIWTFTDKSLSTKDKKVTIIFFTENSESKITIRVD